MKDEIKTAGRPKLANKKKTYSMRLSQETIDWLDNQDGGRGKAVERLVDLAKSFSNTAES